MSQVTPALVDNIIACYERDGSAPTTAWEVYQLAYAWRRANPPSRGEGGATGAVAWMVTRDSCDAPEFFETKEAASRNACLGIADTHVFPLYLAPPAQPAKAERGEEGITWCVACKRDPGGASREFGCGALNCPFPAERGAEDEREAHAAYEAWFKVDANDPAEGSDLETFMTGWRLARRASLAPAQEDAAR